MNHDGEGNCELQGDGGDANRFISPGAIEYCDGTDKDRNKIADQDSEIVIRRHPDNESTVVVRFIVAERIHTINPHHPLTFAHRTVLSMLFHRYITIHAQRAQQGSACTMYPSALFQ